MHPSLERFFGLLLISSRLEISLNSTSSFHYVFLIAVSIV